MADDTPSSYETFQQISALPPDQRREVHKPTGDGQEADFAKLVRAGAIQGHVDNPEAWRTAMRKYARKMKVKLRTHNMGGGLVIAVTADFDQWLRTKQDDPEELRAARAIIRNAFAQDDQQRQE
jgi:hypothetical protein